MALNIGEIVAVVKADVTNFKKGLDEVEKKSMNLEKTASFLAKGLVAGVAVMGTALVGLGVASVKSAIDAEKAWAQINGVLKATAKEYSLTEEQAKKLADTTRLAGDMALKLGFDNEDASLSFAKFNQITGDTTKAQEYLTATMDLARFGGMDLESATKQMTMAMEGGGRVARQLGIDVAENATQQEILGAIQEKVAGQAEEYARSTAGQMDIMKQQMGEAKEAIGSALLPVLNDLLKVITDQLMKIDWQKVADDIRSFINQAVEKFKELKEWIDKNQWVIELFASFVAGALILAIQGLVTMIWSVLIPAFVGIITTLAPIFIVGGVIFLLYKALDYLSKKTTGFSLLDQLKASLELMVEGFKDFIDWIKKAIDWLGKFFKKKSEGDLDVGHRAMGGLVSAGQSYVVGEQGMELFTPTTSGYITPNNQLGGGGVTQNISIYPSDKLDTDILVDRLSYQYRSAL